MRLVILNDKGEIARRCYGIPTELEPDQRLKFFDLIYAKGCQELDGAICSLAGAKGIMTRVNKMYIRVEIIATDVEAFHHVQEKMLGLLLFIDLTPAPLIWTPPSRRRNEPGLN